MAAIGMTAGPFAVPIIVAIGSLATLVVALALMYRKPAENRRSLRIPFAPGLLAAFLAHVVGLGP